MHTSRTPSDEIVPFAISLTKNNNGEAIYQSLNEGLPYNEIRNYSNQRGRRRS